MNMWAIVAAAVIIGAPIVGAAARERGKDEVLEFNRCAEAGIVILDDRVTSADTVAAAVADKCRPEMEIYCRAFYPEEHPMRCNAAGMEKLLGTAQQIIAEKTVTYRAYVRAERPGR